MMLECVRGAALAAAVIMTAALPAAAQEQPAQPAQPAAQPQEGQPAAPEAPQGPVSGPNSLVVSHTLSNLTASPVQVVIQMDGQQLFTGRLEARRPNAPEDEPAPEIKPILTFDIPQEKTLFWEVLYTAIPEEQGRQQQAARPAPPKFCRQAWTAVVAPGAQEPQILIPVQQVNKFGSCDYTIETNDEAVYDVAVKLASAPR